MTFYPYERGSEKVLTMLKGGGGTKGFRVVFTEKLEVLAILKRGRKKFPLFKKVLPCLEGGCKKYRTCDFPIL